MKVFSTVNHVIESDMYIKTWHLGGFNNIYLVMTEHIFGIMTFTANIRGQWSFLILIDVDDDDSCFKCLSCIMIFIRKRWRWWYTLKHIIPVDLIIVIWSYIHTFEELWLPLLIPWTVNISISKRRGRWWLVLRMSVIY